MNGMDYHRKRHYRTNIPIVSNCEMNNCDQRAVQVVEEIIDGERIKVCYKHYHYLMNSGGYRKRS